MANEEGSIMRDLGRFEGKIDSLLIVTTNQARDLEKLMERMTATELSVNARFLAADVASNVRFTGLERWQTRMQATVASVVAIFGILWTVLNFGLPFVLKLFGA